MFSCAWALQHFTRPRFPVSGQGIPPAGSRDGQRPHTSPGRTSNNRVVAVSLYQLLAASLSEATKRTYRNAISIYALFCCSDHDKTKVLGYFPISEANLARFIVYQVNQGYKPASVQTNVAALAYVHNVLGLTSPTSSFAIKKLLLGSRRLVSGQDQRLPVTLNLLHNFVRSVDRVYPMQYERVMYTAMFLLAFHAFLRVGEYTTRSSGSNHAIPRKSIKFSFKKKQIRSVAITLPHFKHSKQPVTLSLKVGKKPKFCPVLAWANYVSLRGTMDGPLFINSDGSAVTTSQFSIVFRQVVVDVNLDPKFFKPHCLRIGGTTWAHSLNFSDSQIREMGRWKSDSYKRYIRTAMAS